MVCVLGNKVTTSRIMVLGRFGRARVTSGKLPGARYAPQGTATRVVSCGSDMAEVKAVAIEASIPRGGMTEYGLVGIEFVPDEKLTGVSISVPWTNEATSLWESDLVASTESAVRGLSGEYVDAVLNGLAGAASGVLLPGRLRVVVAAHGRIGSSPNFFTRIAGACVDCLRRTAISDPEVVAHLMGGHG